MRSPGPPIPDYLEDTYSWAYLHPWSLRVFEHAWVVNLILWGNMKRLTRAVTRELGQGGCERTIQLACVYGDFSRQLAQELERRDGCLDLVDVAPIQLLNARDKLSGFQHVRYLHEDTTSLQSADASYDLTILFFLLHEQPDSVRRQTLAEAVRVTRPGGRVVVVDYGAPGRMHPLRWLMWPVLRWLEPFALALWQREISEFLPEGVAIRSQRSSRYFGGLYQKVVFEREA